MNVLSITVLGNSLTAWATVAAVVLLSYAILALIRDKGLERLLRLATRTGTSWDESLVASLRQTKSLLLVIVSLYLGSRFLDLPPETGRFASSAVTIALFVQVGLWGSAVLTDRLQRYREQLRRENPAAVTSIGAVSFVARLVLWSVVVLLLLDNVGVDITALVAGLGVGGIAVALAVQNILGDLFAALTIVLDKPFAVGDFLIVDDLLGTVESVGIKTTRIRSLSGEQLVFSNSDLLSSRLRNYGRMAERRVAFTIGVTYDTPRDKLKAIPGILNDAVTDFEDTRFDRAHFARYGAYSIDFETVYYIGTPDYNRYMDIQQDINLTIHERFEELGVEFAFPTQTLHVFQERQPGAAAGTAAEPG
jgi:small-conductance mechanosensitive channel